MKERGTPQEQRQENCPEAREAVIDEWEALSKIEVSMCNKECEKLAKCKMLWEMLTIAQDAESQ